MTGTNGTLVPVYRYYVADLITGEIVMEIPFEGVSWERKISTAGSFSGSIAVPSSTALGGERVSSVEDHFDLYNTTVPGKYGLYVMRNGECVWGGIIWSREYSVTDRNLTVTALEFVSYLYHRVFWKTFAADTWENIGTDKTVKEFLTQLITYVNNDQLDVNNDAYGYLASDVHKRIGYYSRSGTTLTLYTEEPHGYTASSPASVVYVDGFADYGITNGSDIDSPAAGWTVTSTPTTRSFTVTTSTSASLALTAIALDAPTHTILKSTRDLLVSNANVRIDIDINNDLGSSAGYTDAYGDNNPFLFRGSEMRYVGEILQNFAQNGVPVRTALGSTLTTATVSGSSMRVVRIARDGSNVATLTTNGAHGFSAGNLVTVANMPTTPVDYSGFNVVNATIISVTEDTFTYSNSGSVVVDFSLLNSFTNTRFDYFIESSYDSVTTTFSNTFKAWLVRQDINDPAAAGTEPDLSELYGPSVLGAGNFVFEHPGNVVDINLNENSDAASTRTWVVDSGNDMGGVAAKYYGGYTNLTYLEDGYPILDSAITDRDLSVASDEQVEPHAKQAGYRLAPPIGNFSVTVNGSLQPVVGTYKPGDWCVVIPNDSFINNRLKPPYENRTGLLVRKIRGYRVNVPDFPAFPETVELELIPEWEVQ